MSRAAPLPLSQAAAELGCTVVTLRRWIRRGAPVARRGSRGRGRCCLVDVAAIATWRSTEAGNLQTVAAELPEVIAAAIVEAFDTIEGLPRQRIAGLMAGTWYVVAVAVLDHLRTSDPEIAELASVPASIERLRKIAAR